MGRWGCPGTLTLLLLLQEIQHGLSWHIIAPRARYSGAIMSMSGEEHQSRVAGLSRRDQVSSFVAAAAILVPLTGGAPKARARPVLDTITPPPLEQFTDPEGVFSIKLPQGWFTKRKGRTEGIVFISGDFQLAITLSVEVLPVAALLRRSGYMDKKAPLPEAPTQWSDFAEYGFDVDTLAGLLTAHKEALVGASNKQVYTMLDKTIKADAEKLKFDFETEVRVERPDLLLDEMGVDKLKRRTTARALLMGDKDKALIVWAGALSREWGRGYDQVLNQVVDSLLPIREAADGNGPETEAEISSAGDANS